MRRIKCLHLLVFVLLVAILTGVRPTISTAQRSEHTGLPALVLLVRHAEKAAVPADDPPLTAAGAERAQALAIALRDAGVTAIITTQLRRTRETAQPLATARGLTPEVVPVRSGETESHAKAVAAAVRRHPGGIVLIAGHSNTVPAIIAALGGPHLPDICESVYANLFILVPGAKEARLVRSHYGAAEPEPGPNCK